MNFDLVILEGPEAGRRIPIPSTPVTLGRAPAASMTFPDDGFISSVHLSVQSDSEGVRITDLRSTNGTFLNGERVSSALANVGDVVQIGTMTMQVAAGAQAQPPKAAPVFSSTIPHRSTAPSEATMIGGPALPRMDIPAPPLVNSSIAATTTIPRISVDASEQFQRVDAVAKKTGGTDAQQAALRRRIATLPGPLFLMVNPEADEAIPAILAMGDVDPAKHCLWRGEPSALPPSWAPYLVETTADSQLLHALLERGWGKDWLSVISAPATHAELLAHFSKFLKVQMDQTGGIYFRFYDPHVLRDFLSSGNPTEIAMFFGPIREWLVEGTTRGTFLQATNGPEGYRLQTI